MTIRQIRELAAPGQESIEFVLGELEKEFSLRERDSKRFNRLYYDTFCRSLAGGNLFLTKRRRNLELAGHRGEEAAVAGAPAKRNFFAWDIENAFLRETIGKRAGIRALSPICEETVVRGGYDLLNTDKKTVVRIHIDDITAKSGAEEKTGLSIVILEGVRGYERQFDTALSIAGDAGLEEIAAPGGRLGFLLGRLGMEVGSYSSKYRLDLPHDVTLRQSVSAICLYLVQAMEVNLPGVVGDIDTEFLHDFRIAVRRTRSLLSQLKKHLPAGEIDVFLDEFKWLGDITGPVRDIDVYLLMREEYRRMLPGELHQGLEEFFEVLEERRITAFETMRKGLQSSRYTELMTRWKSFLVGEDGVNHWSGAEDLCLPVARKIIRKRFRKIIKSGSKMGPDSPDGELHRLRIQGKKLRYLLEFFRSFFDETEIDSFHGQLKKLQNNLGDFNDISVQLEMLESHLLSLSARGKRRLRIAAAIGGLITVLSRQHRMVRRKFEKTFAAFASEENRNRFDSTLG